MRIAFFASGTVPFHAKTLDERPLGGTETGIIRLAEALDRLGHEVSVFTPLENPPVSRPRYFPQSTVETHPPVDVFVAIRDWIPNLYKIEAKRRCLWTGDSYDQFSNFGLGDRRVAARIDELLTVSEWHARTLCEASGFPLEKAWVLGNGIHLPYFDGSETREPQRLIYSSTPHRGLIHVPRLLAMLREKHPTCEIHVFSSYKVYDQTTNRSFEELENLLKKTPGVILHGSVRQTELAREYMKASIWFYPTDFEETSCITAMEAQAAGCVPVTTKLAALPETIGDAGVLVDGLPGKGDYDVRYVHAVSDLLSHPQAWEDLSRRGREKAASFSWTETAKRFVNHFSKLV